MAHRKTFTIDRRFEGPTNITLGSHISGILFDEFTCDTIEVSMQNPTPMGRALVLDTTDPDRVVMYDGDTVLNIARPATLDLDLPGPLSRAQVRQATNQGIEIDFPNCFGCGVARSAADGLHLRSGIVEGQNLVAFEWVPNPTAVGVDAGQDIPKRMLVSALECPIARATSIGGMKAADELAVLGRMTTRLDGRPKAGESCYFVGWTVERVGRRIEIAGALRGWDGAVFAMSRMTFVVLKDGATLG